MLLVFVVWVLLIRAGSVCRYLLPRLVPANDKMIRIYALGLCCLGFADKSRFCLSVIVSKIGTR
jgi:hypothetical protein